MDYDPAPWQRPRLSPVAKKHGKPAGFRALVLVASFAALAVFSVSSVFVGSKWTTLQAKRRLRSRHTYLHIDNWRADIVVHDVWELSAAARFDDGSRALYATDASNYWQVLIGVVRLHPGG